MRNLATVLIIGFLSVQSAYASSVRPAPKVCAEKLKPAEEAFLDEVVGEVDDQEPEIRVRMDILRVAAAEEVSRQRPEIDDDLKEYARLIAEGKTTLKQLAELKRADNYRGASGERYLSYLKDLVRRSRQSGLLSRASSDFKSTLKKLKRNRWRARLKFGSTEVQDYFLNEALKELKTVTFSEYIALLQTLTAKQQIDHLSFLEPKLRDVVVFEPNLSDNKIVELLSMVPEETRWQLAKEFPKLERNKFAYVFAANNRHKLRTVGAAMAIGSMIAVAGNLISEPIEEYRRHERLEEELLRYEDRAATVGYPEVESLETHTSHIPEPSVTFEGQVHANGVPLLNARQNSLLAHYGEWNQLLWSLHTNPNNVWPRDAVACLSHMLQAATPEQKEAYLRDLADYVQAYQAVRHRTSYRSRLEPVSYSDARVSELTASQVREMLELANGYPEIQFQILSGVLFPNLSDADAGHVRQEALPMHEVLEFLNQWDALRLQLGASMTSGFSELDAAGYLADHYALDPSSLLELANTVNTLWGQDSLPSLMRRLRPLLERSFEYLMQHPFGSMRERAQPDFIADMCEANWELSERLASLGYRYQVGDIGTHMYIAISPVTQ